MTDAYDILERFNRNALVETDDNGNVLAIEDWRDPDGRMFRLEYESTPDGLHAFAYCRSNPWGCVGDEDYADSHMAEDGFLCLGEGILDHEDVEASPYDLSFTIKRARFWCTGYSVYKETGEFPNV